jgi:hypothetical protein
VERAYPFAVKQSAYTAGKEIGQGNVLRMRILSLAALDV